MRLTLTFVYKLHLILPTPERAGKSLVWVPSEVDLLQGFKAKGFLKGGDPWGGCGEGRQSLGLELVLASYSDSSQPDLRSQPVLLSSWAWAFLLGLE